MLLQVTHLLPRVNDSQPAPSNLQAPQSKRFEWINGFKNPVDTTIGVVTLALLCVGAVSVGLDLVELQQNPGTTEKVNEVFQRTVLDSISLGGSAASFLDWAHSVEIIALGAYATSVSLFCYGSFLIVSSVGLAKIIKGGCDQSTEAKQFKLGQELTSWSWSALGCATVLGGVGSYPMVMASLVGLNLIFTIAGYWTEQNTLEVSAK